MKQTRLKEILARLGDVTVGVVGDYSLDGYWALDAETEELSVETWKPVNIVASQRYSLGGASNVAANVAALGVGRVKAFAVVGDDGFGRELRRSLEAIGVDCGGVVVQPDAWDTTVFAKPHIGDEEQNRYDFGTYNTIAPTTEARLIANVEAALVEMDALVINQQVPRGYHSDRVVAELNRLIEANPERVFLVDSRDKCERFSNVVLKLNALEASRYCGEARDAGEVVPREEVERYARAIHERCHRPVCITGGEEGMLLFDGARISHVPAVEVSGPIDPVGAGDTTTATLAAVLATGVAIEEAAHVASIAAAVTVGKLRQCGTASPEELLSLCR